MLETKKENVSKIKPSLALWLCVCVAIIFLLAIYHVAVSSLFGDWAERGQFGDSFGFINALFTGLAFSGVIITILMQRFQLEKQLIMINEGKEEDKKERFERSLFLMINLHLDIIDKLDLLGAQKRDVFKAYVFNIQTQSKELEAFAVLSKLSDVELSRLKTAPSKESVEGIVSNNQTVTKDDLNILKELVENSEAIDKFSVTDQDIHEEILKNAIKRSRKRHLGSLGHYFRNLYLIFNSIDEASFLNIDEKIRFSKLVRTQLSSDELLAVFYNSIIEINEDVSGLKPMGYPKMTRLISKYKILKHLGEDQLIHSIHMEIFNRACLRAEKES